MLLLVVVAVVSAPAGVLPLPPGLQLLPRSQQRAVVVVRQQRPHSVSRHRSGSGRGAAAAAGGSLAARVAPQHYGGLGHLSVRFGWTMMKMLLTFNAERCSLRRSIKNAVT